MVVGKQNVAAELAQAACCLAQQADRHQHGTRAPEVDQTALGSLPHDRVIAIGTKKNRLSKLGGFFAVAKRFKQR
jgi:hypothetical protein